ncbi:hypothetical protein HMPREF1212_05079 [Parabacteroides sp. HGS0025]|uniref:hypothetical protein n=1 Tax=Parabacteroides sp. HGS0025 TaxID=1078087 RepID=UPI000616E812|nr:hypothetical protein [Parabacteroides sp. HGS0025]KKB45408.1 hypothetical protein HMPREF1212_05081 [Parabacteroides sp. HGS0025]KKB45923.1 hypothetical protein HMPREF1212_05079 [Parabacteroides sp. HGS0025]
MTINVYIGNPVIANHEQYYKLEELLHEIDPDCEAVHLLPNRLIIENIRRRTFVYPCNPTMEWVADRLRSMVENGL